MPASDTGKRITLEFDGAYRETMVVFNGFYIGRHSGGYDPFRFDVTDFANPGGRNVLLVRVDATESDGWFYEGAGIYRHVWLVKTNPVHVKQWGTFVRRSQARRGHTLDPHRSEQSTASPPPMPAWFLRFSIPRAKPSAKRSRRRLRFRAAPSRPTSRR